MDAQLRSQNSLFGKLSLPNSFQRFPNSKTLAIENLNILLQCVDGAELELKVAKNKFE